VLAAPHYTVIAGGEDTSVETDVAIISDRIPSAYAICRFNLSRLANLVGVDDGGLMAKRNPYDGHCSECHAQVRALEGVIEASDAWPWWRILCPEHVPAGALEPPKPLEASKLPSIHLGDERFER
jgi:hypothetical protein